MDANSEKEFICAGGFCEPDPVNLRAGIITLQYSGGSIRYLKAGSTELLRMIYPAIRNSSWLTAPGSVTDEKIEDFGSSFKVTVTVSYRLEEIDFISTYTITGGEDNSVVFSMEGKALSSFRRNRIGLCILHPIEGVKGKACVVLHPDGTTSQKPFPEEISPHQVFKNIRAMNWPAAHGRCMLTFEGDVFETEDQRNWTDASFKTYSTPLSVPYPVLVEEGTEIRQSVSFRAENILFEGESDSETTNIEIFHDEVWRLPSIGIGRATGRPHLSEAEIRILRPLRFDHYRIDIHLFSEGWEYSADEALREAEMLSYKCEFALFFSDNFAEETENLINWLKHKDISITCALIYHKDSHTTPEKLANYVIPLLMEQVPGIRTGTGTNASYVQINRSRPGDYYAGLTCFSLHPQEHASDNRTLVENLAAQAYAAENANAISGDRGVWISPVTLRRRFNPNRSFYEEQVDSDSLPENVDPRIMSLFGACWAAISLKYLCQSEISGITCFETAGERGIIQGEYPSRWPAKFPAKRGTIFPVYFIFKYLLKYKNLKIVRSKSTNPLISDALVLTDGKQVRMMLVNFTGKQQRVSLTGCKGVMKLLTFNCANYQEAAMNHHWNCENGESTCQSARPFMLQPWSVTFIEGWMKQ